jgi:FkbM family methyltransferase
MIYCTELTHTTMNSFGSRAKLYLRHNIPLAFRTAGFFKNALSGKAKKVSWGAFTDAVRGKIFYGQIQEDRVMYETFFETPPYRNGFFVELGAFDGLNLSNTKFFEDYLGWRGLLIEPNPEEFKRLTDNRPKCILVNAAVSTVDGEVSFLGNGGTGGMIHTMADEFKEQWHSDHNKRPYSVPSMPFKKILQQHQVKRIDLLSVDVEGGEFEVLDTLDWNIPIYVIGIELDNHNPEKDEKCRALLRKNGFSFVKKVDVCELWQNPAHKRTLSTSS